ncbi:MAG: class F sortase [Candidatus Peregrinibacteria bacterium]
MHQKMVFRWLPIITSGAFFAFIPVFFFIFPQHLSSENPLENLPNAIQTLKNASAAETPEDSSPKITTPQKKNLEPQIRLKIPKIQIDTVLESVGLTDTGAMGVPQNPAYAAWFTNGPSPGEIGNAVISGHSGAWGKHTKTVFNDLYQLQKGDLVYITNPKGEIIPFKVMDKKNYDHHADASEVFTPHDAKAHLNLITCEGVWDPVSQSYPQRLVIFTERK